jgi:hypothetical protein
VIYDNGACILILDFGCYISQEWERYQRRKPLQELVRGCVKILVFIRRRLFSGWGKWFQEGFVLSEDSLEEYMAAITKSPLNSIPRLRALESMFHLSYSSSNQLVMAQGDVLAFMMGEVKKAEDGSKQQAMALAIIRNLCMLSGYRPSAAKEVTEMLVAVCWAVNDDACKQHALGALANLSANERPGELILAQNVSAKLLISLICPVCVQLRKRATYKENITGFGCCAAPLSVWLALRKALDGSRASCAQSCAHGPFQSQCGPKKSVLHREEQGP